MTTAADLSHPGHPLQVRAATEADLPIVHDIWYQLDADDNPHAPPPGPVLTSFRYEQARGAIVVAEQAGEALGFGASVRWDDPTTGRQLTYLADLFIQRRRQSRGVGQAILAALPLREGPTCVHASSDPRASALYIRWGMRPRWPNYWLVGGPGALRLGALPGADVELAEAAPDDPAFGAWDARSFGFPRPHDLAWLLAERDALPVWFRRGGATLGYGLLQRRSDEALERPDAWTLGPIGAQTPDAARDCVGAAVHWSLTAGGAAQLRLGIPGPHPALAPLIEAGAHITYIETFLASEGAPIFDPTRYLQGGVFL